MIISTCPRCQEVFRVPLGTMPQDAYAMCPWCHETFPLTEVLDQLPPPLQILTADGEPITVMEPVAAHSTAGIDSLTGATTGSLANLSAGDDLVGNDHWDPAALDFGTESGNGNTDTGWSPGTATQTAPMKVSPRPNRRKKSGSGIRSMIQVVVGGLLSVPIALGILLAVGRAPDLGFWPFDGQSRSAQELLPFLNGETETDSDTEPEDFGGQLLDTSQFDKAMQETEDPAQAVLDELLQPEPSADDNDQSNLDQNKSTPGAVASSLNLAEMSPDSSASENNEIPPELPKTSSDATAASQNAVSQNRGEKTESGISPPTSGNTGIPATTIAASQTKPSLKTDESITQSSQSQTLPAEVMVQVTEAIQALEKLETADQQSDTDRLAEAYERLAEACETSKTYPKALNALATSIQQSGASTQLQEAAVTWLEYPQRSSQGIVLFGKPGTTAKSQILTLDSGRVLTMKGNLTLPLSEHVMVLGQITKEADVIEISFTAPLP